MDEKDEIYQLRRKVENMEKALVHWRRESDKDTARIRNLKGRLDALMDRGTGALEALHRLSEFVGAVISSAKTNPPVCESAQTDGRRPLRGESTENERMAALEAEDRDLHAKLLAFHARRVLELTAEIPPRERSETVGADSETQGSVLDGEKA